MLFSLIFYIPNLFQIKLLFDVNQKISAQFENQASDVCKA